MTSAYVDCLKRAAAGHPIHEDELNAAMGSVGASPARFGRDVIQYRCAPATFHDCIKEPVLPATPPPSPNGKHKEIYLAFAHGLGDNCQAIALLWLWKSRGYDVRVLPGDDKRWLWGAAGFDILNEPEDATFSHPWIYPSQFFAHDRERYPDWVANKTGYNACTDQLPMLGSAESLWPEVCKSRPDVREGIGEAARTDALRFLAPLPRPIVLVHTKGASWIDKKSWAAIEVTQFYESMLRQFAGSIVMIDNAGGEPLYYEQGVEQQRVVRAPAWDVHTLAAAIDASDLLVGIDSGPVHLARLLDARTLCVTFPELPARFVALPHERTRWLIPCEHQQAWMHRDQTGWESVGYNGSRPMPGEIAEQALHMLGSKPGELSQPLKRYEGFWVRQGSLGGQDANVIHEVCRGDTYQLDKLKPAVPGLVVVDVGAHIGTFSVEWHKRHPSSIMVCVEVCPENLPALAANVAGFASIIHAACTYLPGRLALRNSVKSGGTATGGSIVLPLDDLDAQLDDWGADHHLYWDDRRALPKVTLEQIQTMLGVERIDVLKLDCEGSEFSILAGADLSRIGCIVGEWHGSAWDEFRRERLAGWEYVVTQGTVGGAIGAFRARNPVGCKV